jgi:hypothetical protein
VYDEDERADGLAAKNGLGEGGHVVCAILSPLAVSGSYGGTLYHYSLLRTVEDGLQGGHSREAVRRRGRRVAPVHGAFILSRRACHGRSTSPATKHTPPALTRGCGMAVSS